MTVRWVDVDEGDDKNMNIRSMVVGREFNAKWKDAPLAHGLFSAMPPRKFFKFLFGLLVTDGVPGPTMPTNSDHDSVINRNGDDGGGNDDELVLGTHTIPRAHCMPKVSDMST